MAARGPQNGRRGLEMCPTLGFGRSRQLSLNRFFDPSTPSMRKGRDGELKMENGMEKKNNGENSGPLSSLPVDRLTATDCNAAARANKWASLTPPCVWHSSAPAC